MVAISPKKRREDKILNRAEVEVQSSDNYYRYSVRRSSVTKGLQIEVLSVDAEIPMENIRWSHSPDMVQRLRLQISSCNKLHHEGGLNATWL